mgnify:CR=1 FL=1
MVRLAAAATYSLQVTPRNHAIMVTVSDRLTCVALVGRSRDSEARHGGRHFLRAAWKRIGTVLLSTCGPQDEDKGCICSVQRASFQLSASFFPLLVI